MSVALYISVCVCVCAQKATMDRRGQNYDEGSGLQYVQIDGLVRRFVCSMSVRFLNGLLPGLVGCKAN